MVKHIKAIRRLLQTNCLSVVDHFVELAPKGLKPENMKPSLENKATF